MRIAYVGTGWIAEKHADGLAKRDDVTLVGVFDVAPERAKGFVARYGGIAYTGLQEMLDQAKPDAVWVGVPPFAHGETEMALLKRRIPFLVEKPVSNSMETALRIQGEVERTGTLTAAGYMNRYRRGVERAKEVLASDPPILVHGGWVGRTPPEPWFWVKAQSGGQIVEQTTHVFDLVRYLAGEPKVVRALGTRGYVRGLANYDLEDASTVMVELMSGAVGNIVSCCGCSVGGGVHLSIAARQHHIAFTGWNHTAVIRKSPTEEEHIDGEQNIFELEDAAFIKAVQTGNAELVRSPYADAVKTLAFCLAANKSLETGEPVEVESLLP